MINRLRGKVDDIFSDHVILDVCGVGYRVFCSHRTLDMLPPKGEEAKLEIETHVREDHIHLFGFINQDERSWFHLLTSVQGVGARLGLAILGALSGDELSLAIASDDKTMMSKPAGVGPKLAQRICRELKDKVGKIQLSGSNQATLSGGGSHVSANQQMIKDANSALVNLGFSPSQVHAAISMVIKEVNADVTLEQLIAQSLKELV